MDKILVIGRCWKFVEFLIPTVESVLRFHDPRDVDLIVFDNKSSRSSIIRDYCERLVRCSQLKYFIEMEKNYFANAWRVLRLFREELKKYDYISMTDMDLRIINGFPNWLYRLSGLLKDHPEIGAVSGEFDPMPKYSGPFVHVNEAAPTPVPGFWEMVTDGWFYTVRRDELLAFIDAGGIGPGMHGYSDFMRHRGKKVGRTNLRFYHYGWLRADDEYKNAYKETGIEFNMQNIGADAVQYIRMQEETGRHDEIKLKVYARPAPAAS
jgi:hypothetical protein